MLNKYSYVLPYILIALCLVVVFGPVLFFGKVFFGEEQHGFYYATSYFVHQKLLAGEPLLWNSSYFGGVSASLDQFVGAFYPLNLFLLKQYNHFTAHHLSILIASIVGLWLAYVFGRQQGWRVEPAILFSFGYFTATTFGLIQIGTIVAHGLIVFPALLIAIELAHRKKFIAAVALGSIGLGIGFLAGFMQAIFYYLVSAGCYALFKDLFRSGAFSKETGSFYLRFRSSITFIMIVVIGLVIGAKQFYPSAYLIDLTIRTSTYAAQNAVSSYPTELITLLLPPYFTMPFIGGGSSPGFYIGSFGIIMAVIGLIFYRTRESIFFAGLYALLAAFAFHLPVFGWINEHVPPFSHMGASIRWLIGGAIPLSFLAAAGLDGFLRNPEKINHRNRLIILACAVIILLGLSLSALMIDAIAAYVTRSPYWIDKIISWYGAAKNLAHAEEFYRPLVTKSLADLSTMFSLLSWRFLAAIITWLTAAVGLWAIFFWRYGERQRVTISLAVIVLVFLLPITAQWSEMVPRKIYAEEPLLAKTILSRETDSRSYRMLGYLVGDGLFDRLFSKRTYTPSEITSIHNQVISNNSNVYWGIERMDGMEPYRTLRINRLLNTVIAHDFAVLAFDRASPVLATAPLDKLYNREVQKRVSIPEKLLDLRDRTVLLGMMNVKYVYSPYQLAGPDLVYVSEIPLTAGAATSSLYLYEIKPFLPRIYVAQHPQFVRDERSALLRVIDERDFKNNTYIECADCGGGEGATGTFSVVRYTDGDVEIIANMKTVGWLVFSESAMPGWHAEVDGLEAPIRTANYIFQSIRVPAGMHKVNFVYKDVSPI